MRKNHVGRVENAFALGTLAQIYQLSHGDTHKYEGEMRFLSTESNRIWTPTATLLPTNESVRTAAKALYDHAASPESVTIPVLTSAIDALMSYYAEE